MTVMRELLAEGQSIWLDYIRRSLIESGELADLVDRGLRGVTSNPSIFEKAIAGGNEYDDDLRALLEEDPDAEPAALFEALAVEDIRMAADVLRPVYDGSDGDDGYVSIEVSPHLADDTEGSIEEARRLWQAVDRPNLMIKIPATKAGIPAIEQLIGEGINVNVTLMFSLDHYDDVAGAYLRGLDRLDDPGRVASVASFFVSRVETKVDARLDALDTDEAGSLRGTIAVANAKLAYDRFKRVFHGDRFADQRERGARVQRVLFGSTSTKDPAYSDVKYIEELIGPETVNTIPPDTLEAVRDHGTVARTLDRAVDEARDRLDRLAALGIDLDEITERLQREGVKKFADSYDELLASIAAKRARILSDGARPQRLALGEHGERVEERLERWKGDHVARRLWSKDPTIWADEDTPEITDRLGWLHLPEQMRDRVAELRELADEVKADGVRDIVLLGMGGSSLAPELFQRTLGNAEGHPRLRVLDSTHPDAVRAIERDIELDATLFVVASKSGTTVETLSFFRYFWSRIEATGSAPGRQFVAISDPGTPLVELARERGFRRVFEAAPDVGGRYSALSHFGLVPAALIGADVDALLEHAWTMAEACAFCVPEPDNPALELGAALGELALAGRDKVTFLTTPRLHALQDWTEQLIAESTGKEGAGIVPVAHEPPGEPERYGDDRVFVLVMLESEADGAAELVEAQVRAGHPVVRIALEDTAELGRELFRWEMAVAAAGAVLGIHPFDQPDVQLAKKLAREALGGAGGGAGADDVIEADDPALDGALGEWLDTARPGDYIGIQAYLAPTGGTTRALQQLRAKLRDRTRLATTLGYGPRFLHSTGQLHKGGPDTGLFLQIVDEPGSDLEIPETDDSFGRLIRAQADGDAGALRQRDRRLVRVRVGADTAAGIRGIAEAIHG